MTNGKISPDSHLGERLDHHACFALKKYFIYAAARSRGRIF